MIKLNRNFAPIKLTPTFVNNATIEFQINGTNVWNIDWLKESLLDLSKRKCAYCECKLQVGPIYVEVEHFEDKANNSNKVLEWDNLLPSCKRCNGAKGTHDVISTPIVNPFVDNPQDEFFIRRYRIKGKTQKGKETEGVINLNDQTKAVIERFEIGEKLEDLIDTCKNKLDLFVAYSITRRKNEFLNSFNRMLLECQPNSDYSATCATILHSNEVYQEIKELTEVLGLWTDEFEVMHNASLDVILERR